MHRSILFIALGLFTHLLSAETASIPASSDYKIISTYQLGTSPTHVSIQNQKDKSVIRGKIGSTLRGVTFIAIETLENKAKRLLAEIEGKQYYVYLKTAAQSDALYSEAELLEIQENFKAQLKETVVQKINYNGAPLGTVIEAMIKSASENGEAPAESGETIVLDIDDEHIDILNSPIHMTLVNFTAERIISLAAKQANVEYEIQGNRLILRPKIATESK